MSSVRTRSRKPSVRHRRLPEPFTFFVDECLGRHIVTRALGGALLDGEHIVTRPQGTMDEAWLPEAGERWICLTKDHALKRRPNELDAIRRVGAAPAPTISRSSRG